MRLKNINVGYWNCRSVKQRGGELERLCYNFDVLLLQETKAVTVKCPGYTCYSNPTRKTHHGQAILVRTDLQHQVLDMDAWDKEDREIQAVQLEVKGRKWVKKPRRHGNQNRRQPKNGTKRRNDMIPMKTKGSR